MPPRCFTMDEELSITDGWAPMFGTFRDVEELQSWAQAQSRRAREDYVATGTLISLGYALAMADIAASEIRSGSDAAAYQLGLVSVPDEPVLLHRLTDSAAA